MNHISGRQRWAILLCGVPGQPSPVTRRNRGDFVDLFVNNGPNSLNRYWRDVSLGAINLDGSQVLGWVDLPDSFSTIMNRTQRIIAAAEHFSTRADTSQQVDFRNFDGILVVTDATVDLTGVRLPQPINLNGETRSYRLVICGQNHVHSQIAHEMGHAFGLDHSFDTAPTSHDPADDGRPGAYGDPWDIMSAMVGIRTHLRPPFGAAGPGLNAVNLDLLGWLPPSRVAVLRGDGHRLNATVHLRPLNRHDLPGHLAATFDSLYVEFRIDTPSNDTFNNWDDGLARPAVLVHTTGAGSRPEIDDDTHSVLLANAFGVQDLRAGEVLELGDPKWPFQPYTLIEVLAIDAVNMTATVNIQWRAAQPEPGHVGIVDWILQGVIGVGPRGQIVKVPPRQPVRTILSGLAISEIAQLLDDEEAREIANRAAMQIIARTAQKELG
jgi:hypothetical protein